ncbi:hypothetical protein FRIGORI9N_100018 [Frigoribacterium sp. 9N]|nr:hypothetical protein FRIGORI9N_100018 [Frigoribacterium sp. 9N]
MFQLKCAIGELKPEAVVKSYNYLPASEATGEMFEGANS